MAMLTDQSLHLYVQLAHPSTHSLEQPIVLPNDDP